MSVSHTRVFPTLPAVAVTRQEVGALMETLAQVPDPRAPRGIRHLLVAVLMVVVIAVLAGAQNFREIGDEAADLPQDILRRIGARYSTLLGRWVAASAATIRRVISGLDADRLDEAIYQ